jgi:amino acid transporter
MAMADRGEMPKIFGRVHPVFRTPWFSILAFAVVSWLLALQAGLLQNISLAAVSRLFTYGLVCAALPKLRRMDTALDPGVEPARVRVPMGTVLAAIAMAVALVLGSRMNLREAATLAVVVAIATVHWLALRLRAPIRVS